MAKQRDYGVGVIGKCPVCGKSFIIPTENVYKLQIKGCTKHYCSYTCFRVEQKKREK